MLCRVHDPISMGNSCGRSASSNRRGGKRAPKINVYGNPKSLRGLIEKKMVRLLKP